MDALLNKVGSYWLGQKASKEFNSVGDDINSLSTSIEGGTKWLVNKLKGKMQKPLPDLLKEYDLPIGIFPLGYKDSSVVRFLTIVTGYLEKGKIADIEGMKTKVMIWVKVTCIASSGSKLNFTAGMKKSRDRVAYEVLRDGVAVDKF
ncbi:T31J12.3 PROTEIN-RELATED [Salix purpurea]|uniref:T31J12.3 PROTEIN-RELATED n=1 Tax=Salix purpurea TaxID=77065 RepID=A0A9Q0T3S4_SALPP|nr:T31J12.3 PROTEIN-RELATED [Salix purpurea]